MGSVTLRILREVARIASAHGVDYFVIGATARDIMLTHVFGMASGRATRDVDFALAIEDWSLFESIRQELSAIDGFTLANTAVHRLHYRSPTGEAGLVDLVPFGGVELSPGTIAWPPDMSVLMNVAGYHEALAAAAEVAVSDDLVVRVASIPALVILKLFAWQDRGHENPKDADDLLFLMRRYAAAGNLDRLYDTEFSLLEAAGHDPDMAGIALLGKDVGTLAGPRFANGALSCSAPLRFAIASPCRWHVRAAGSTAPWRTPNRLSRNSSAVWACPASVHEAFSA